MQVLGVTFPPGVRLCILTRHTLQWLTRPPGSGAVPLCWLLRAVMSLKMHTSTVSPCQNHTVVAMFPQHMQKQSINKGCCLFEQGYQHI